MTNYITPIKLPDGDGGKYQVGDIVYDIQRTAAKMGWEVSVFPEGKEPYMIFLSDPLIEIIDAIRENRLPK